MSEDSPTYEFYSDQNEQDEFVEAYNAVPEHVEWVIADWAVAEAQAYALAHHSQGNISRIGALLFHILNLLDGHVEGFDIHRVLPSLVRALERLDEQRAMAEKQGETMQ